MREKVILLGKCIVMGGWERPDMPPAYPHGRPAEKWGNAMDAEEKEKESELLARAK